MRSTPGSNPVTIQTADPFDWEPSTANAVLLSFLPKLLAWEGDSLVRFASCVLCGDSKLLESIGGGEGDRH